MQVQIDMPKLDHLASTTFQTEMCCSVASVNYIGFLVS